MIYLLALISLLGGITWFVYTVYKPSLNTLQQEKIQRMGNGDTYSPQLQTLSAETAWLKSKRWYAYPLILGSIFTLAVVKDIFYAESGYNYHVRTALGNEIMVVDIGWKWYPLGKVNGWKKSMTVQSTNRPTTDIPDQDDETNAESDTTSSSASLPSTRLMFLDQVDALADATVRFSLPSDEASFLRMAREYRSPDNLLRTALIPAFKETLRATGSLMSAEDYYAGKQTQFNVDFDDQMTGGIFLVNRKEGQVKVSKPAKASANASKGTNQEEYGDDTTTQFEIERVEDETGKVVRRPQKFNNFGIVVVDARVTDMNPNPAFLQRMTLKQKASADRAIAREQRIQEQEQKLLAVSKGERQVAERQAAARVEQIQLTTEAETTKQLAITKATQQKEQAEIQKETAAINLDKAKIEAQTIETLADAEAHQKRVLLAADNALQPKLDAELAIQKVWATAMAQRKVPTTVFVTGSGSSDVPTGADDDMRRLLQLKSLELSKTLNYDRNVEK